MICRLAQYQQSNADSVDLGLVADFSPCCEKGESRGQIRR
jgi:hypothetical protein